MGKCKGYAFIDFDVIHFKLLQNGKFWPFIHANCCNLRRVGYSFINCCYLRRVVYSFILIVAIWVGLAIHSFKLFQSGWFGHTFILTVATWAGCADLQQNICDPISRRWSWIDFEILYKIVFPTLSLTFL